MKPKISVVLPVYNGEDRVSKSIESIIAQDYDNWELIVVNDCSTDGTLDVVKKYAEADSRIRVISNDVNSKLPRTLNNGFKCVTGEYLTWTSDDNAYKENAFSTMVEYLNNHPDVDMVYTDFNVVDLDGTYRWTKNTFEPEEMKYQNAVGACFMYRKSLADKIGEYDPELFLAEDYEYWIKAYLNGHLQHLSVNLYNYGWHDKSLTLTKRIQVCHKAFEAKNKHFEELLARCNTQEEKNLFYWSMLEHLLDKTEKENTRLEYYRRDLEFKKADKKKIRIERFKEFIIIKQLREIRMKLLLKKEV